MKEQPTFDKTLGIGICNKTHFTYSGRPAKDIKVISETEAVIQLTQNKTTLINRFCIPLVQPFNWYYSDGYAAVRVLVNSKPQKLFMHQLIMNTGFMNGKGQGKVVDHKNRDALDNTINNLRIVGHRMNGENKCNNTSGYTGVNWVESRKKWRAQIRFNGKKQHLGYFTSPEEASLKYFLALSRLANGKHPKTGASLT